MSFIIQRVTQGKEQIAPLCDNPKKTAWHNAVRSNKLVTMLLVALFAITGSSYAQCLATSLKINTGYNPVTNTVIGSGSADPHWTISALSPNNTTVCGCSAGGSAIVIPALSIWYTTTVSGWISFFNASSYATTATGNYKTDFSRTFKVCRPGNYALNFTIACDNEITDMLVDGISTGFTQDYTVGQTSQNFQKTLNLACGTHTIVVKTVQAAEDFSSGNGFGLNIRGTITAVSGIASIVREDVASCTGYACSSPITGPSSVCVGSSITLADATPGGTWSSSGGVSLATGGTTSKVVTGTSPGIATVSYTTACSTVTKTITVLSLPNAGTITPSNPCFGSTALQTTTGSAGGVWTSASPGIGTFYTPAILTGIAPGTTVISYTVTNSCGTATSTAMVTVKSVAPITGNTPVCVGSTITLHNTSSGAWSTSDSHITVNPGTGVVTGVNAGTGIVSYTSSGCVTTAIVIVNPLPVVPASVTVCTDSAINITATPGTGVWTGGSAAISITDIGSGIGTVAAVAAGTAVLTYTDINGCAATTAAEMYCPCAAMDSYATTLTSSVDYGKGCDFTCTASTSTINGWTMAGYLWQVGSNPPVWNASTATSDNQSVSLAYSGTEVVTVIFYAVDSIGDTCTQTRTINLSCERQPCVDKHNFDVTSTTDADGNCTFTATVDIATSHTILGYEWTTTGSAPVVDYSGASSDSYTFTVPAGSSTSVSVTVHIVDPYFAPGTSPCCDVTYSQSVSCADTVPPPCNCFAPNTRITYTMLSPEECTGKTNDNTSTAGIAAGTQQSSDPGSVVVVPADGDAGSVVVTQQGKGCCFKVTAAALISRQCKVTNYQWFVNGTLAWSDATSAPTDTHIISIPSSGAAVEVIITAIDNNGQKCIYDTVFKLSCGCNCFNDAATTLTAAQASMKACDIARNGDNTSSPLGEPASSEIGVTRTGCCYNVTAVAGLSNGCTIQSYQWNVDGSLTIIPSSLISSTIPVYVAPAGTSTVTVTIIAIDASGQRCEITKELVLGCGCKCLNADATTITQSPAPRIPPRGCAKVVTVNTGLIDPCKIVSYTWQATGVTTTTDYTSSTTANHTFIVPAMGSIMVTVTIKAVDDHNDTCIVIKSISLSCDDKDYNCCFDQAACTLVGGLTFPPTDGAGNCLFQFTANYSFIAGLGCRFLGYIWQLGSHPATGIIPLSTVNLSAPPGSTPSATVTFVAINGMTGDTCKYTRSLSFRPCRGHAKSNDNAGDDPMTNSGIRIFPNPTDDVVNISSDNADIRTIQVFDVNGKKVADYNYEQAQTANISLGNLAPGAYLLRINNTVSKVVTKIH